MLSEFDQVIGYTIPEATYFSWIDVRRLELTGNPQQFFLDRAKVALSDGTSFGRAGAGHVRLNLALPQHLLVEALDAILEAITWQLAAAG